MPNKKAGWSRNLTVAEPTLLLCAGKDCFRNEHTAFKKLEASASNAGLQLEKIKCQGSCKGPTAVVPTESGPRWFEALDSAKSRGDLIAFATGAEQPTRRLAKRELTGKRRKKAATKLAAQLG